MIKNIKIWIGEKNGEYSRKVQEYLFSQGVLWQDSKDTVVRYTHTTHMVVDNQQRLACGTVSATEFKSINFCKEMKLIETVSYTLEEVREKICIGGKEYYIDELEVALKNIKPI
jgi:hypothetical protein